MARWIPTKRQKYGVGEYSPHPVPAAKFGGAALPGAKLGGGRTATRCAPARDPAPAPAAATRPGAAKARFGLHSFLGAVRAGARSGSLMGGSHSEFGASEWLKVQLVSGLAIPPPDSQGCSALQSRNDLSEGARCASFGAPCRGARAHCPPIPRPAWVRVAPFSTL